MVFLLWYFPPHSPNLSSHRHCLTIHHLTENKQQHKQGFHMLQRREVTKQTRVKKRTLFNNTRKYREVTKQTRLKKITLFNNTRKYRKVRNYIYYSAVTYNNGEGCNCIKFVNMSLSINLCNLFIGIYIKTSVGKIYNKNKSTKTIKFKPITPICMGFQQSNAIMV